MLTVVSPPSPLCHCACAVLIVEIHLLTPRVVSYMHVVQDKEKINTSVVSGFICGGWKINQWQGNRESETRCVLRWIAHTERRKKSESGERVFFVFFVLFLGALVIEVNGTTMTHRDRWSIVPLWSTDSCFCKLFLTLRHLHVSSVDRLPSGNDQCKTTSTSVISTPIKREWNGKCTFKSKDSLLFHWSLTFTFFSHSKNNTNWSDLRDIILCKLTHSIAFPLLPLHLPSILSTVQHMSFTRISHLREHFIHFAASFFAFSLPLSAALLMRKSMT